MPPELFHGAKVLESKHVVHNARNMASVASDSVPAFFLAGRLALRSYRRSLVGTGDTENV